MNLFWIISTIATMNRIQHHTTIQAFYSNNIDKGRKIKIVRLLMCIPATFIKNIIEFNQNHCSMCMAVWFDLQLELKNSTRNKSRMYRITCAYNHSNEMNNPTVHNETNLNHHLKLVSSLIQNKRLRSQQQREN